MKRQIKRKEKSEQEYEEKMHRNCETKQRQRRAEWRKWGKTRKPRMTRKKQEEQNHLILLNESRKIKWLSLRPFNWNFGLYSHSNKKIICFIGTAHARLRPIREWNVIGCILIFRQNGLLFLAVRTKMIPCAFEGLRVRIRTRLEDQRLKKECSGSKGTAACFRIRNGRFIMKSD